MINPCSQIIVLKLYVEHEKRGEEKGKSGIQNWVNEPLEFIMLPLESAAVQIVLVVCWAQSSGKEGLLAWRTINYFGP